MALPLTEEVANLVQGLVQAAGPAGLFALFALMTVESFGFPPLPSELILPLAGLILADGSDPWFTWPSVMAAAVGGGVLGAFIAYGIGRQWGLPLVQRYGRHLGLEEKDLHRAEEFFDRRGPITVLFARVVPIIRAYISYPAGAAKMHRGRFGLYTTVGLTPFALAWVYAGYVLGQQSLQTLQRFYELMDVLVAVAVVALLAYAVYRLRGRWVRLHSSTSGAGPSRRGTGPEGP